MKTVQQIMQETNAQANLIPAHAGVIPGTLAASLLRTAYPRARGGDPQQPGQVLAVLLLSPRTRG